MIGYIQIQIQIIWFSHADNQFMIYLLKSNLDKSTTYYIYLNKYECELHTDPETE